MLGLFGVDMFCYLQGEWVCEGVEVLAQENLPEFFKQFMINADGLEQTVWRLEEGTRVLDMDAYMFSHKEVYEYLPGLSSLNVGTAFVLFAAGLLGIAGGIFLMRGQKFGLAMYYGSHIIGIIYATIYCLMYSKITWVPMVFVFLLQWLFGVLMIVFVSMYFKKRKIFAGKPIR